MEFYATLGRSCENRALLTQMFRAGMSGVRLNLSHTDLASCASLLTGTLFPAARQAGVESPHLIIDLQGPELRVGSLPMSIPLAEGEEVLLGDGGIPVPPALLAAAKPGQEIALDDSALLLRVRKSSRSVLLCRVVRGGLLRSRKSLALLGCQLDCPTLTGDDLDNLDLAGELGVTHILQPFVRDQKDLRTLRRALEEGRIAGAGLDTLDQEPAPLDHPLIDLPPQLRERVVLSPHIGGLTTAFYRRGHLHMWQNIQCIAQGQRPDSVVNGL